MKNQFKANNDPKNRPRWEQYIRRTYETFLSRDYVPDINEFTIEGTEEFIKQLPNEKGPGPDGTTNENIKLLTPTLRTRLITIFNAIQLTQHFPKCWKHAHIILIPKPANH